jgi:hypothetical protein
MYESSPQSSSPRDARDLDQFVAWRSAATRVEQAFAAWRTAPDDQRTEAFAAYTRALDDEGALAHECSSGLRDAHMLGLVQLRG